MRPDPSERLNKLAPSKGPSRSLIGTVVIIVALLFIGGGYWLTQHLSEDNSTAVAPKGGLPGGNGLEVYASTGDEKQPRVDIYSDFQCPHCGSLDKVSGPAIFAAAKADKIKLYVHLESFLDRGATGPSTKMANAAFCAADYGKLPEFYQRGFAAHPSQGGAGFSDESILAIGQESGISGADYDAWKECVTSLKYESYVKATAEQMTESGISSTPTVLINGKVPADSEQKALFSDPKAFDAILQRVK